MNTPYISRYNALNKTIIGICGLYGSGKSTVAKIIWMLTSHKADVFINSFGNPVKEIATECFRWDGEKNARGRKLLQVIGTGCGREYNPDIWLGYAYSKEAERLSNLPVNSPAIVVYDDVRFNNEAEYITNAGGFIIGLTDDENKDSVITQHRSEQLIDEKHIKHKIHNDNNALHLVIDTIKILKAENINILRTGDL